MTRACPDCLQPPDVDEPGFEWAPCPFHAKERATDPDAEYDADVAATGERSLSDAAWREVEDMVMGVMP